MNALTKMNELEIENHWTKTAEDLLVGKKIIRVRYFTYQEGEKMGWTNRPVAFLLDSGIWVFPSMDDEGNDGGALFTSHPDTSVLPVLR